jgi:hypothetical protein
MQAVLEDHPSDTRGLFEVIERVGNTDAILTVTNEAGVIVPRVYPLAGLPQAYTGALYPHDPITIDPDAQAYLDYGNPDPTTDLVATTIEDYTFILNRKVNVDILRTAGVPQVNPTRVPEAMVWVRASAYARTYKIVVTPAGAGAVTVILKTPDGSASTNAEWVDTDKIAASLISGAYTALNGASITGNLAALAASNFVITQIGGVIYLKRTSGGDFTIAVEDGQGGIAFTALKGKVQRFSDLPQKSVEGFTLRVTQSTGDGDDDYYVAFEETAGSGTGIWKEVLGAGAQLGIDPATMPVGLFNDGSWKLQVLPWKPRQIGDETLAKDPDFVGQPLSDLTFWRGRLALFSDEGISLSAAEDPFRHYPKTLTTVVDSDPLGLISPYPNVSKLRYGVPFESSLIGFGDIAQVQVTSNGVVSLNNASIDVLSAYEFLTTARPQAVNGKLYFLAPHGEQYATVYELAVSRLNNAINNLTDADDLSTDTPRLLPVGIDRVAGCAVNYTVMYGVSGTSVLYPHLFRHKDRERVQNAFVDGWNLPEGYLLGGMFFRNTKLYVLACKDGFSSIAMADLSPALRDPGSSNILTTLDFRASEVQVDRSYSSTTNLTTLTLPFARTNAVQVSVRAPGGPGGEYLSDGSLSAQPEGFLIPVALDQSAAGDDQILLEGDWTGCPLWVGFRYAARWRPTRLYAITQDGTPLRSGRLGLRRLIADVAETSYVRCEVTVGTRPPKATEMTGYSWDAPNSLYDKPPFYTGPFKVALHGESEQTTIDFINDQHLGMSLLGFEWRGELNLKASKL